MNWDIIIIRCYVGENKGRATVYPETKAGEFLFAKLWEDLKEVTIPNHLVNEIVEDIKKIDRSIQIEIR